MAKKKSKKIAVCDAETDMFIHGRIPEPFAWEFYDGETRVKFWAKNCTRDFLQFLEDLDDEYIIYAHNGGKFDFMYFLRSGVITNPIMVISGRLTKAYLGKHELRDSFSILPLTLERLGGKKSIDYEKMEAPVRNKHKKEILEYLDADCDALYDKVIKFRERFGDALTIGSAAIKELTRCHKDMVSRRGPAHDGALGEREYSSDYGFRRFYFGGRVEAFETGEVVARPDHTFKIFDVNSMYSKAMRDYDHPTTSHYIKANKSIITKFDPSTGEIDGVDGLYFMRFTGRNQGAIPKRLENGNLSFNVEYGEFFACSHEIKIACKYGRVQIHEISELLIPMTFGRFNTFVDKFSAEKIKAKLSGDVAGEIFAKLILNSAYGKFATNPHKFKEWYSFNRKLDDRQAFTDWYDNSIVLDDDYTAIRVPEIQLDTGDVELWSVGTEPSWSQFLDVAVAASITSASRSILLEALINADRPIYCDTDSLICDQINGVEISSTVLGAWKHEGTTDRVWIAGKKNYACRLIDKFDENGEGAVKIATKGSRISFDEMKRVALGEVVLWENPAPNFKLNGSTKFISRKIRKTDDAGVNS